MITIKIDYLKKEISQLEKLIEEYQINYRYLYKELSETFFSWKEDRHAKAFFDVIKIKKTSEINHYNSIVYLYRVFKYIYDNYSKFGNEVNIDLQERDNILEKYNNCISGTNDLITLYSHLDTSFCPEERQLIVNQINKLKEIKESYTASKERTKEAFDRISKIEKEVKKRIASLEISEIEEINISQYLPGA